MASRARSIRRLVSSVARLIDPVSDHIDHADVDQHELCRSRRTAPEDLVVIFVVKEPRDRHARTVCVFDCFDDQAVRGLNPVAPIRGGRQLASR
jgi:hypothetical protein